MSIASEHRKRINKIMKHRMSKERTNDLRQALAYASKDALHQRSYGVGGLYEFKDGSILRVDADHLLTSTVRGRTALQAARSEVRS